MFNSINNDIAISSLPHNKSIEQYVNLGQFAKIPTDSLFQTRASDFNKASRQIDNNNPRSPLALSN